MLFLTVFGLTFLAELPDKTTFAAILLAAKRSHVAVFVGAAAALFVQCLIAIAFGRVLGLLPQHVVRVAAGLLFLFMAGVMLKRHGEAPEIRAAHDHGFWADAKTSFVVMFVAEWGDLTQFSTAALEAKYHSPLIILAAATLALWTVLAMAVAVGSRMKRLIKPRTLDAVAAAAFAVVGLVLLAAP